MTTPDSEIEMLRKEFLEGEDAEFLRYYLALAVASRIVQYQDPGLLDKMPPWVGDMVREMCDVYLDQGNYIIVSNLGETDRTEMVAELTRILGITAAPQP
ncbi:MAG: hypothetical protein RIR70_452 [Pseudomonadota bacterium]